MDKLIPAQLIQIRALRAGGNGDGVITDHLWFKDPLRTYKRHRFTPIGKTMDQVFPVKYIFRDLRLVLKPLEDARPNRSGFLVFHLQLGFC